MNKKCPYEQLCIDLIIVIRTNTMRQAYFVSYSFYKNYSIS